MNLHAPLEADRFYHIYNRGINGETLFKQERNYAYFLSKYALYLSPVVDTYAYCLLGNHFHLLIKVKEQDELDSFYKTNYPPKLKIPNEGLHSADFVVSKQFARLFSSFTQAINKSVNRTGSLIETPFKRIHVENDAYFSQMVWYIHFNPQKHGFVNDFRDYPHSSYQSHLLSNYTRLKRDEVLKWFGGKDYYHDFHSIQQNAENIKDWTIEFD